MAKHGKKYLEAAQQVDRNKYYEPQEAADLIKTISYPKFDGT